MYSLCRAGHSRSVHSSNSGKPLMQSSLRLGSLPTVRILQFMQFLKLCLGKREDGSSEDEIYKVYSNKEDSTDEDIANCSGKDEFFTTLESSYVDEELRNAKETMRDLKKKGQIRKTKLLIKGLIPAIEEELLDTEHKRGDVYVLVNGGHEGTEQQQSQGVGQHTDAAAAVPATATLLYTVGKDSSTPILRKGPSIQNLDNNREMLERELQKLLAVATDIDQGCVKKEEIKNTSTCKLWITRVWEIQAEVEALIQEHEGIKEKFRREINIVAKGRLSQKMVNKLEEVIQHLEEGKFMIANFQRDY
ncbi:hypothetical protein GH714_023741 [Hevea brasiliensis]|uniref:Uncharacterized protein n=1 Tax=Hevea brasiliensis TaxID=3981 RepID=A0A6A6N6D3_HEVBR|nr:hypothetical protein GH714_023741 [Hevea brasiliensis]